MFCYGVALFRGLVGLVMGVLLDTSMLFSIHGVTCTWASPLLPL